MLVETSAQGSAPSARPRVSGGRVHDDAPDSAADFARLAALSEGPERDVIRDELAKVWLPMAHRIAGRFRNRGESLEDLRQVAALGLVKAIDRYEPGRGAFESYAVPTITGEIKRHFRDRMWALRVPRRVQELRNKVRIARRDLAESATGSNPSVTEIAAHTGLTEEEVNAGLEALESFSTLSLDAEMSSSDDGFSLADTIGSLRRVVRRRHRPRGGEGGTAAPARARTRHLVHALLRGHDAEPHRRSTGHLPDARLPPHQPVLRPDPGRGARPGAGALLRRRRRQRPDSVTRDRSDSRHPGDHLIQER